MNFPSLLVLAFAMSTDAFAAAIGKGAALGRPKFLQALRIGLLFGVIEAITPLIGWVAGSVATKWVAQWDHWIAFVLLLVLGLRMIREGMGQDDDEAEVNAAPKQQSLPMLALTAVATSIDAMAVGVGLAFVDVSILEASLLIGLATTMMVTIGVMVGRALGAIVGKRAEIIGGVVLIGVGVVILVEHLAG